MTGHGEPYDLVVVGAGMGGSIIAARCAAAGMRTLVIEAGWTITQTRPSSGGLIARLRRKLAQSITPDPEGERWPRTMLLRSAPDRRWREVKPILGRGPGGSARIYGAALGRARPQDFAESVDPAAWHPDAEAALPNAWPVEFTAFRDWYREAEQLLRVVGTPDPLDPADDAALRDPPRISPGHERIAEALRANGRHPFRMHVGIDYRPGCHECQGSTCPRACKSHGFNRALAPALAADHPVRLEERLLVGKVDRGSDGTLHLECEDSDGTTRTVPARTLVLAAGALNTPLILQRSTGLWGGPAPAMVGAGMMFHSSEIFAVSGLAAETLYGPRKVLAFRDHYRDGAAPLAEVQSMGLTPSAGLIAGYLADRAAEMGLPLGFSQIALRVPAAVAAARFAGAELFTAALEDIPYADNRVDEVIGADGVPRIAVTYRAREEMLVRSRRFRALAREAFAPLKLSFLARPGEPNRGHPMGTCRMGTDPRTSVVDAECRVRGQPGIYVADASVFPSSLGINPALTVAANALRVAATICASHTAR